MRKTEEMERLEFRDWERRHATNPIAAKRDIRDLILDAFDEGMDLPGAATILGVHATTLSRWINNDLDGDVKTRAVFPGFIRTPAGAERPGAVAERVPA